jgi:VWFA-related protein
MKKVLMFLLIISSFVLPQSKQAVNPDQYIFSKKAELNSEGQKFDPSKVNADQYYFLNKKIAGDALKQANQTAGKIILGEAPEAKKVLKPQSAKLSNTTSAQSSYVLKYDNGTYSNRIGTSGSNTFEGMARFTQSMVSSYVGWRLTTIQVYIADQPLSAKIKIYDGGTSTSPGTLLYSQVFTPVINSFNTITLTTPVTITNKDIWVGYECGISANYPMGVDSGPATADGDWLYYNASWTHLAASSLNYNWIIHATIESPALILTYNQIDASSLPTIKSYVTVTDNNGNPIGGLTSSNFTVTENSTTRTPITVTTAGGTGSAISVALVIDKSGSMSGTPLSDAQTAATTFVNNMQTNDQGAVISFDDIVTVVKGYTTDKTALKTAISGIVSGNYTAIYDAVYQAVDLTRLQSGRKAIILMTDGDDNSSTHTITATVNYAVQYSIPVYTIGLGITSGSSGETTLQQIATQTGGKYYLAPTSSQLTSIYQSISQQLNNQYMITYTSPIQCGTTSAVTVGITATYNGASDTKTKQYTPPACNNLTLTYNQIDNSSCPTIKSYVTVTDLNGVPITGLTSSNFTVKEENVTQNVTVTSAGGSGSAISVALVIDKSGSMSGTPLADAISAANSFVNNMQTSDKGAVIAFDDIVTVTQAFTSDKTALKTAINSIVYGNNTAIYDAMYKAVDITKVQTGRKAVVLMTDGTDNSSSHTMTDAINYAISNSIPVYTIGLGISAGSTSETSLQSIATQTGGKYYLAPNSSQLLSIYQSISQQLNNQYLITYTASTKATTTRTVSITVTYNGSTDVKTKTYSSCTNAIENYTIPSEFSLSQNYPNPFNPSTRIMYSVPKTVHVKIVLYNVLGVEMAVLVDSERPAGNYEAELNGSSMASGVYFIRMSAGTFTETRKIMLMK